MGHTIEIISKIIEVNVDIKTLTFLQIFYFFKTSWNEKCA